MSRSPLSLSLTHTLQSLLLHPVPISIASSYTPNEGKCQDEAETDQGLKYRIPHHVYCSQFPMFGNITYSTLAHTPPQTSFIQADAV